MRPALPSSSRLTTLLLLLAALPVVGGTVYLVLLGCGGSVPVKRETRVLIPGAAMPVLVSSVAPAPAVADRDGDGVVDSFDQCPLERGLPEDRGCPKPSAPAPTPAPIGAPRAKPTIVAVFDTEDATGRLDAKTLNQLTEYLAAKVTESGNFRVIPRNQLKTRLSQEKREGYKVCYDESCKIELGRALSAQKSLATKLLKVGASCAISATLYDLKSETAEKAANVRTNCSEDGLMDGMEKIATQLAAAKTL
ncbi:MAG: hypothetical protein IT371_19870 [Deltaproteobacteria bacterium]|nr:hypothetical protein [Deltaproteobacteria bacterium]